MTLSQDIIFLKGLDTPSFMSYYREEPKEEPMTTITEQRYIEEEYFTAVCTGLLLAGCDEAGIEENAHRIMDAWTFDGVLDTDNLDAVMAAWPSENDIWENDYND